jgi:hypothetical protein
VCHLFADRELDNRDEKRHPRVIESRGFFLPFTYVALHGLDQPAETALIDGDLPWRESSLSRAEAEVEKVILREDWQKLCPAAVLLSPLVP